jgi:hypothetical protein
MGDLNDLARKFRQIDHAVRVTIPRKFGQSMKDETRGNFLASGYKNDGGIKKWADRPFEKLLRYKKLMYTKRLFNSFSFNIKQSGKNTFDVAMGSDCSYAKVQQEGGYGNNKIVHRVRPYATTNIHWKQGKIRPRKFMGFGLASALRFKEIMDATLGKIILR